MLKPDIVVAAVVININDDVSMEQICP